MWTEITIEEFASLYYNNIIETRTVEDGASITKMVSGTKLRTQSNFEVTNDYTIQLLPPTFYMWEVLTDKEIVLKEYPTAVAIKYGNGTHVVYGSKFPMSEKLGSGTTEEEAWANAAKDLT